MIRTFKPAKDFRLSWTHVRKTDSVTLVNDFAIINGIMGVGEINDESEEHVYPVAHLHLKPKDIEILKSNCHQTIIAK